jgi:hypothetical protein
MAVSQYGVRCRSVAAPRWIMPGDNAALAIERDKAIPRSG